MKMKRTLLFLTALAIALLALPVFAGAVEPLSLISKDANDVSPFGGNQGSSSPQINEAGQVVFYSSANNLLTSGNPTNTYSNIYLYDPIATGEKLTLITANATGAGGANGRSYSPQINEAGQVVFYSSANNLLTSGNPVDTSHNNVYLYDPTATGEKLTLITKDANDVSPFGGNQGSSSPRINEAGQVVFISSANNLLASNNPANTSYYNIYLYDPIATGEKLTLITANAIGAGGANDGSYSPQINEAGQVVFSTNANNLLTSGNPTNTYSNIYLYDPIATGEKLTLITANATGAGGANGGSYSPQINKAGQIVFESQGDNLLTSGNPVSTIYSNIYLYDPIATGEKLTLITKDANDASPFGGNQSSDSPQINEAGQIVFKSKGNNLLTSGNPVSTIYSNIYLYDPIVTDEKLTLITRDANDASPFGGNQSSDIPHINETGQVVFISRAGNLLTSGNFANNYFRIYLYSPNGIGEKLTSFTGDALGADEDYGESQSAHLNDAGQVVFSSDVNSLLSKGNPTNDVYNIYLYTPPDIQAPTIDISLGDGTRTRSGEVTLTATDNKDSSPALYWKVGDEATQTASKEAILTLPDGVHSITYWALDESGNTSEYHVVTITVDSTAPITVSKLPTGTYSLGTKLELSATDNLTGVETIYYTINGGATLQASAATPTVYIAPVILSTAGTYVIEFWSTDVLGNTEKVKQVTYTIKAASTSGANTGGTQENTSVGQEASDVLDAVDTGAKTGDMATFWVIALLTLVATTGMALLSRKHLEK
ncbi:MAG: chitobiase/beta-hexosaminidase C-terminal domain-containing protein [Actinomycetes bacterium]|nr:chitobiase/beta-hexosaminidase C-terminal domain-containing protein [Actinomycetes bacterium]